MKMGINLVRHRYINCQPNWWVAHAQWAASKWKWWRCRRWVSCAVPPSTWAPHCCRPRPSVMCRAGTQRCGTGTGTVGTVTFGQWNRNRNRNLLKSRNRNRNRNYCNYGSGTGTRYKIMWVFDFLHLTVFHSHFSINLFKFINFFLLKHLTK